jgi:putative transcriptional regulator
MDTSCEDSMACGEKDHLEAAESTLRQAGFNVSQPCSSRPSCFDLAARRDKTLIFVRFQPDIGGFSSCDSQELRAISESFSAASLLIGGEAREKPLEDDTVYTRHEILAVTSKTFENVVLHGTLPLIQANPGGYYVEVDGEALKAKRQELGLSVGEMAAMVGTSRRTIYGYERGMAKASVTAAYNLIWALGIPVARPINILEKSKAGRKQCILITARLMFARNKLLNRIFRKYVRCAITTVKRAPFDFVITVPEENMRIIGGIANSKEQELDKRVDEILSVSRVVQAHPILITEGQEPSEKNIPCISSEKVSRMRNAEDLIANIR